jgi:adenylate cyclase
MAIGLRGFDRLCLGIPGWKDDADAAIAMAAPLDSTSHVLALMWKYIVAIPIGARPPDTTALGQTADALRIAEQSGEDFSLGLARLTRGLALVCHDGAHREDGLASLAYARDAAMTERFTKIALPIADPELAKQKARTGDLDGAVAMAQAVVHDEFDTGEMIWRGRATAALVELLLGRGTGDDLQHAQAAIDRLAADPTNPGFLLHELPLLRSRALLTRAHGDENSCRNFMERHRAKAAAAGFEALLATADATAVAPPTLITVDLQHGYRSP